LNGNDTTIAAAQVTPQIKLKSTDSNTIKFTNGTATLDVYSKSEVDNLITNKLVGLNPMRYMGLTSAKWPKAGENLVAGEIYKPGDVALGDTYKVNEDKKYTTTGKYISNQILPQGAQWAKKGDIFIATGTEVEGVIGNDFSWDYIPSGDDNAVTYEGASITHGIKIQESASSGTQSLIAQLQLQAGNSITLTDVSETPSDDPKTNTITITHDNVTRSNAADTEEDQDHAVKTDSGYIKETSVAFIDTVTAND
jgi:hypothetical protein